MDMATTADGGKVFGRGISFPPRIVNGRMAWSEGEMNVREAIQIVLLTERRERLRLPQFGAGLGQFLFEPNTVSTRQLVAERISKALIQWEPRIAVESVEVDPDPSDAEAAVATIVFKLVATQAREQVSLSVTLGN